MRDFSIHVREGEFVAVTGPSGRARPPFSTIAGLLEEFSGGEYQLDGADVRGLNDNQRSRLRNEKIGFIFQAFNLIADLNVQDNIDVPLRYRGFDGAERRRRIQESLGPRGLVGARRGTTRRNCRAASSSAWPLRARSPGRRGCCWRMNPPAISTRRWRAASWSCSRNCIATASTIVMVTHDPELAVRAQREVHIVDGQVVDLAPQPRLVAAATRQHLGDSSCSTTTSTLALRSLKRNVVLTVLMIAAIGVGIGASMTTLTVFRAMAAIPFRSKSRQLFAVQIDNWGPKKSIVGGDKDNLQEQISYIDAVGLMNAHAAHRQSAMYTTGAALTPSNPDLRPFQVQIRAAYTDFFPMFDVPFRYGRPLDSRGRRRVTRMSS